ncbi:RnfABCDGE type electron transport complex subunit G [Spirochaetota bacterium]
MNIIKPTIILAAVAFISAFALSHINRVTSPAILKQEVEKQKKALSFVLPGFKVGKKEKVKVEGESIVFWRGESVKKVATESTSKKKKKKKKTKGKIIKGYAFITSMPGYSGDVQSMVGIDDKGSILGVSILGQTETPGLGARCIEVASKNTFFGFLLGTESVSAEMSKPWFLVQFNGLNIYRKIKILKMGDFKQELKEKLLRENAISSITGATITSRAVVKSLEKGIALLKKLKQKDSDEKEKAK